MKAGLSADRLRELLEYDPREGKFCWKRAKGRARRGDAAGHLCKASGYIQLRIDGRLYAAHRLAWLYVHGRWPVADLDHVNGNRACNRISNLREATRSENNENIRAPRKDNKSSGLLGVTWDKNRGMWQAQIQAKKKRHNLGRFATAEEAHAAYLKAKAELHPFQTITGS